MKAAIVVGTRPEAIKMAPLVLALKADADFDCTLISTGQHREMLTQVFDWFGLEPDIDLALMSANQTLSSFMSKALSALDGQLEKHGFDCILAQGDTTTVLAAAIAAFHRQVPFGHVEAGLRTYDLAAPFPEEANRALVGRIASINFAPTDRSVEALKAEKVPGRIVRVGNTVIDALLWTAGRTQKLERFKRDRLVLITGHRRENHGERFSDAFRALGELATRFPDVDFVYPVHLNPKVRAMALELLSGIDNFSLIDPLPYPELVGLMQSSVLVITDSGGIQEEAPSFNVPVLVMRDTTERQEAVEAGVCELVGVDPERIISRATEVLQGRGPDLSKASNPFGDGHAAEYIRDELKFLHRTSAGSD